MSDLGSVAGIDGWKGGWVGVVLSGGSFRRALVAEKFDDALDGVDEASVVAVDIPIGLPASGRRRADAEARAFIGPRRSSVFSAPPRTVLEAGSYQKALALSREQFGFGITKEAYLLGPKTLEVAELAARDDRIYEVHPEVSFRALAGEPLKYSKKTWAGQSIRRSLLERAGIIIPEDLGPAGTAPVDDVLDAAAAAWSAARIATGDGRRLPSSSEPGDPGAIWY